MSSFAPPGFRTSIRWYWVLFSHTGAECRTQVTVVCSVHGVFNWHSRPPLLPAFWRRFGVSWVLIDVFCPLYQPVLYLLEDVCWISLSWLFCMSYLWSGFKLHLTCLPVETYISDVIYLIHTMSTHTCWRTDMYLHHGYSLQRMSLTCLLN